MSGIAPGGKDRELDAGTVRELLRAQFPQLAPFEVRYLAEGWDNEMYEVNGRWLMRLPKRANAATYQPLKRRLLEGLRAQLPLSIPHFELQGRASALFPYDFVGYRKLDGVFANEVPLKRFATDENAAKLGGLLSTLHAVPVEQARAWGVGGSDSASQAEELADRMTTVREQREAIDRAFGPERAARYAGFVERAEVSVEETAQRVLIHDDLDTGHILLDDSTHEVSAVIDWADASIGDPASDFVCLWVRCGETFLQSLIDHYTLPVDAGLPERVRFRGRWALLDWVGDTLQQDPENVQQWLDCFEHVFPEGFEGR